MEDRFFARLRPFSQFIILAVVTVLLFIVFNLLALLGAVAFFHVPIAELTSVMNANQADNIPLLKFVQIMNSLGLFIFPALILALLASSRPFLWLGFSNRISWTSVGWLMLILLATQPLVAYTGVLNQQMQLPDFLAGMEQWMKSMEDKAMGLTEAFLDVDSLPGLGVNLLMVAIIPGIGEELFFRGLLQPIFGKWFKNIHAGVLVTAFLFSALHMQFYGFLPRFLLGVLFGYLFVWSGNLWFPILAHLIHNTIPVLAYYFYSGELTESGVESFANGPLAWVWAIISLTFLVLFCRQFIESARHHTINKPIN